MAAGRGSNLARSIRFCGRWRLKVNSLWLWWYCVLVLAMEGYLMYRAVLRCKSFNELSWKSSDKPVVELYVYIGLIVISVMCFPFFIITSIFKIGNYANDGSRLGRDTSATLRPDLDSSGSSSDLHNGSGDVTWTQALWRHSGPLCHGFHVLAAFMLLLPRTLMDAQEIKYGFSDPDGLWRSDLDAVALDDVDVTYAGANLTNAYSSGVMTSAVSPEFINYVVALLFFGLRYAAVFWYTKMAYSFLFAFVMITNTAQFAFSFCSVSVLYKFGVNMAAVQDLHLILPGGGTLILHLAACLLVHLAPTTLFNYGYAQFTIKWQKFLITHFPLLTRRIHHDNTSCCYGYVPNIHATCFMVAVVGLRAPIVYDYVMLYRVTEHRLIMAAIVMEAVFTFVWILVWFTLTVKQRWSFKVLLMKRLEQEIADAQPAVYTIHSDHLRNNKLEGSAPPPPREQEAPQRTAEAEVRPEAPRQSESAPVRRVHSETMPPRQKPHDMTLDSTVDSTITRNYRRSIRDICGYYYYREDEEPVEHSSPRSQDGAQLPPLQPHRSLPDMKEEPPYYSRNVDDPAAYRHSMHLPPQSHNPHRPSREVAIPPRYHTYSKPPPAHPQPPHRHSREITSNQVPEAAPTCTRPLREFLESNAPLAANKRIDFSRPEPRMTDTLSRPPPRSAQPPRPDQPYMQSSPYRRSQSPSYATYQNVPGQKGAAPVVPPREGRAKSSLNGRDSALPSSTDTSSNESHENVLCSQV
ncbi:hypothetical protein CAPTEDRAFT_224725 [Capitella teleta]|uniref:Protein tincar n=1 Tax=Capitella teleta TaxID=283909 RepID=R7TFH9_CAPTE|nr:hypothetical protein CAPTEDRAFT_224725 [Capitella teleta]|eukprot:ELT89781.1 hypothetical protein CAPTEDRAFT_224725 [Capitella teleta]